MARFRHLLFIVLIALLTASCGMTRRGSDFSYKEPVSTTVISNTYENADLRSLDVLETGIASWYGPKFHGRLTANGETYDMDGITAAHRTLPFGTVLLVENIDNGRTVNVRVNDRGPFAKDRIIDLSRGAAKTVDMIGPGTANVRLYLLDGDLKNSRVTDLKVANFTIQLGSYKYKEQAQTESQKIKGSRVEEILVNGENFYRIFYGVYQDLDKANNQLRILQSQGFTGFVKQIENNT